MYEWTNEVRDWTKQMTEVEDLEWLHCVTKWNEVNEWTEWIDGMNANDGNEWMNGELIEGSREGERCRLPRHDEIKSWQDDCDNRWSEFDSHEVDHRRLPRLEQTFVAWLTDWLVGWLTYLLTSLLAGWLNDNPSEWRMEQVTSDCTQHGNKDGHWWGQNISWCGSGQLICHHSSWSSSNSLQSVLFNVDFGIWFID